MNIFVKITKKGGYFRPQAPDWWRGKLTWRGEWGPGDQLTWRAGPPRRYDAALRPRGRTRVAHAGR